MNIKEMLNRVLDVLKDKHTTWFYVEFPKIDMEALRKKIIAILKDKHGGIGMIPADEIEALADVILPGVIKFFSSDEGVPSLKRGRRNKMRKISRQT